MSLFALDFASFLNGDFRWEILGEHLHNIKYQVLTADRNFSFIAHSSHLTRECALDDCFQSDHRDFSDVRVAFSLLGLQYLQTSIKTMDKSDTYTRRIENHAVSANQLRVIHSLAPLTQVR